MSRITSANSLRGNVAVKGKHLYVPQYSTNHTIAVTPYDINNPSEPIALNTFIGTETEIGRGSSATLHIQDKYLTVVTDRKGFLFDISDVNKVKLIDENEAISSNGIGIGYGNDLFTVASFSAGHLQRSVVNLAPEQTNLSLNLLEDATASLEFSATDNEQDSLSYSLVTAPEKGTLSIEDNTSLIYTGDANKFGTDKAVLMVTDSHGGASHFDVNINITPVNDAPVIETSNIEVTEDTSSSVSLTAKDIDSDQLTFSLVTAPKHGSAELTADGMVTYLSNTNYNGSDSIEVKVSDGDNVTDTKVIAITVTAVNDAPMFDEAEVSIEVPERQAYSATLVATDIDNDNLTFSVSQQANKGNATVDQQGVVTYTPNSTGTGADSFTVTVSDTAGETATKTVSVNITAAVEQTTTPTSTSTPTPKAANSGGGSDSGGSFNWLYLTAILLLTVKRRFLS